MRSGIRGKMDKRSMREVLEGKNLERNLPPVLTKLATINGIFAELSFSMEYFRFCESVREGETELTEETAALFQRLSLIAEENLSGDFDAAAREDAVQQLFGMRDRITQKMHVLTAYTDIMTLYEYMLNRMELRYAEVGDIDCDAAAEEIIQFIFMEKDNVTVNERIRAMLSQLPIRMSRGRFCDIVKNGFEPYAGMERSAAEDYAYRVESAAGLYRPAGFEDAFPEIFESWRHFQETDWNGIEERKFLEKQAELDAVSGLLKGHTDQYFSLMELVNHLCAWLLAMPYAGAEAEDRLLKLRSMTARISRCMRSAVPAQDGGMPAEGCACNEELQNTGTQPHHDKSEQEDWPSEEESGSAFRSIEGLIESSALELQRGQAVLAGLPAQAEQAAADAMLGPLLSCVRISGRLLEDSLFTELKEKTEKGKAERRELEELSGALCAKLQDAFSAQPQLLNRAMIASVLFQLPVFFETRAEVAEYVRTSLAGCRDLAEKVQSVRLMKQWMEE